MGDKNTPDQPAEGATAGANTNGEQTPGQQATPGAGLPPQRPRTFMADFRKFFGRGLAILLPSILTLWILATLFGFVHRNIGSPINRGIRLAILEVMPYTYGDVAPPAEAQADNSVIGPRPPATNIQRLKQPPSWWTPTDRQITFFINRQREEGRNIPLAGEPGYEAAFERGRKDLRVELFRRWWNSHWYLEATGLVVAIILIYLAGLILGNFLGRRMYQRLEGLLGRVPGFKQIYPHVKQLVDMIMGDRPMAFKRAVLVQYPSENIWTLGLVTSESMPLIEKSIGKPVYSVFIPSTPTPFTGFTITVPRDAVIDLPVSMDQALRFIVTAGVLNTDDPRKAIEQARTMMMAPADELTDEKFAQRRAQASDSDKSSDSDGSRS